MLEELRLEFQEVQFFMYKCTSLMVVPSTPTYLGTAVHG